MRSLDEIATFGATHAAAALVTRDAGVDVAGDLSWRFALASVSKLLTAYAIALATEEATMALTDPLGPPGSTVAHVLSHASGLSPADPKVALAPPGTRRIYSNAGFELLGTYLEQQSGMAFERYVGEGVLGPLAMQATDFEGSPAYGAAGTVGDLARFAGELLAPSILSAATLDRATTVAFPGLSGVLPGFGRQDPCDFGLGFEIKDRKDPHWTGGRNAPTSFGHFGQSGTFVLVDPVAGYSLVCCTDRAFGDWAVAAWPAFCDAVYEEFVGRT